MSGLIVSLTVLALLFLLQANLLCVIITSVFYRPIVLDFDESQDFVKLVVGDQIIYHGAFNQFPEISPGVVVEIGHSNLIKVKLYEICNNNGIKIEAECDIWAHRKQLVLSVIDHEV